MVAGATIDYDALPLGVHVKQLVSDEKEFCMDPNLANVETVFLSVLSTVIRSEITSNVVIIVNLVSIIVVVTITITSGMVVIVAIDIITVIVVVTVQVPTCIKILFISYLYLRSSNVGFHLWFSPMSTNRSVQQTFRCL